MWEIKNTNLMTQAEKLTSRYSIAIFFLLLLLLKVEVLFWPPVWDEAFSIFPAGYFLAQNNFNFLELLRQPGYVYGGPNVHSLTWGTLLAAIGYRFAPDLNTLFLCTHLFQLFVAALGLSIWFKIFKTYFHWQIAFVATLLILFYPLFSVQAGRMYLEIFLFTATAFVFYFLQQRKFLPLLISFVCAFFAKISAIVLLPAIACSILLAKDIPRSLRVAWSIVILAIGSGLYFGVSSLKALSVTPPLVREDLTLSSCTQMFFSDYFSSVPDLMFLVFAAPICFLVMLSTFRRGEVNEPEMRLVYSSIILLFSVVIVFLFLFPIFQKEECAVLPRYFLVVLPALVLLFLAALKSVLRAIEFKLALDFCLIYAVVNQGGYLYPGLAQQSIAVAERSNEYLDISKVQRMAFAELEKLPKDIPLFHSLPDTFYARYPVGYVTQPLSQGISVSTTAPYASHKLSVFPEHFFAYIEFPNLGGRALKGLIEEAKSHPDYEVSLLKRIEFSSAKAKIYSVRRRVAEE